MAVGTMIVLNQDHIKKVVSVIKALAVVPLNFNSQLAWTSSFLICCL